MYGQFVHILIPGLMVHVCERVGRREVVLEVVVVVVVVVLEPSVCGLMIPSTLPPLPRESSSVPGGPR